MKKICIFDFDGTLVDTFTDAGIYYNKALEKYGFPIHELEEYKYLMGGSLEEVVTRILPEEERTRENIENVKNEYWSTYPNSKKEKTLPYEGIIDLLTKLQQNNIKLAINTNKKQYMVEKLCEELFPNITFSVIAGNSNEYPPKPDPAGIEMILRKCNCKKEECVYIGDSKYDFETAKNANTDAILVTWGAYKKEYETIDVVTFVANKPYEIAEYVL